MKETKPRNVTFGKAGGNASKNAVTPKISLPKLWLDKMKVTQDEREVTIEFDGKQITIKKAK